MLTSVGSVVSSKHWSDGLTPSSVCTLHGLVPSPTPSRADLHHSSHTHEHEITTDIIKHTASFSS